MSEESNYGYQKSKKNWDERPLEKKMRFFFAEQRYNLIMKYELYSGSLGHFM